MNALTQEGAWSWYTGWGGVKAPLVAGVGHAYVPRRSHTEAMQEATEEELGEAVSATAYARRGHGAFWTRGHAAIRYEWCHLVAHGLGGPDEPENIVAATAFQNTEQLILESVLYEYRMEGFQVRVRAKLARGTRHLGESIHYQVLLNGGVTYERTMDCRRATDPTYQEFRVVAADMRARLNDALARANPCQGFDPEVLEHFEEHTDPGDDYFRRWC